MDEKQWQEILHRGIACAASDIHVTAHQRVQMRCDGLLAAAHEAVPTETFVHMLCEAMLSPAQRAQLIHQGTVDFSWNYENRRFRGNVYLVQGTPAFCLRMLPPRIPALDELDMPPALSALMEVRDGLVLITGATGSGKTTTLAAVLDAINHTRALHIITLEDPVEYVFSPDHAFISQREFGMDFHTFPAAVRSAMREDPDIILIGEIRDRATMEAALYAAMTGVLVFGTLHTRCAAQTAMRIEGMFDARERDSVRAQFADVMQGIFAQRLLRCKDGGRTAAVEVLCATTAVRNMIRQGRYEQLSSVMMSGAAQGMQTAEMAEAVLRAKGRIA